MENRKLKISLILNFFFVVLELVGFVYAFGDMGLATLQFYTQLSNLFAFLVVSVYIVFEISLLKKGLQIPNVVKTLKYVATCCLTMTFLIVVFVLAPFSGYSFPFLMFASSMLYHHTLCPILSIITFLFFEQIFVLKKERIYALTPTLIYAVICLGLNIMKLADGPYFFLQVYSQPWYMSIVWGVVCLGFAYLIVYVLSKLKNIITNRHK